MSYPAADAPVTFGPSGIVMAVSAPSNDSAAVRTALYDPSAATVKSTSSFVASNSVTAAPAEMPSTSANSKKSTPRRIARIASPPLGLHSMV